jgi:hypothetical protein
MDTPADVVALARGLITLSRAGCTGVLTITASGKQCQVALAQGGARAATAGGESVLLGDYLLRRGELDIAAHEAALCDDGPRTPVGAWLFARGIASQSAIEGALQDQLCARVLAVFRWRGLSYTFEPGAADIGVPWLHAPVDLAELALAGARAAVEPLLLDKWASAGLETPVVLSAFGRALLRTETLSASMPNLRALLWQGARLQQLVAACHGSETELRSLAALCWLSAIVPAAESCSRYSILLRKHGQLRRRASAAELLEVGRDAAAHDVRRALRRLAKDVHPDALGPLVPSGVREASGELMRALVQAEHELRPSPARVR